MKASIRVSISFLLLAQAVCRSSGSTENGEKSLIRKASASNVTLSGGSLFSKSYSYGDFLEQERIKKTSKFAHGGPVPVYPVFSREMQRPGSGRTIALSLHNAGLFIKEGRSWRRLQIPERYAPSDYYGPTLYRDTLDLWQNPARPLHLLIVQKHDLLESQDGGFSFKKRSVSSRNSDLFTSIAATTNATGEMQKIALGTAASGLLLQENASARHSSWKRLTRGLPGQPHDASLTFYEEIGDLSFDGQSQLRFQLRHTGQNCALAGSAIACNPAPGVAGNALPVEISYRPPAYPARANINAAYIPASLARNTAALDKLFSPGGPFNAAVIDYKDDFGRLLAGSQTELSMEMNNNAPRAPIRDLVQKLTKSKIATIARIVVFKDSRLIAFQKGRHAIQSSSGGVWQGKTEEDRWIDPFSEKAQIYNLEIALEAQEMGFSEIQFDYIRFPSDGPIGLCRYAHMPGGSYKSEALEAFLRRARSFLKIPISIDLFGYNAIYRAGGVIGQDYLDLSDYVDAISPMHYSSHFGSAFMREHPRDRRAHELLLFACQRARQASQEKVLIRPWLQAFDMLSGIWGYGTPYFQGQLQGARGGGCEGGMWWGSAADLMRVKAGLAN